MAGLDFYLLENLGVGTPEGVDCIVGENFLTGFGPVADIGRRKKRTILKTLGDSTSEDSSEIEEIYR